MKFLMKGMYTFISIYARMSAYLEIHSLIYILLLKKSLLIPSKTSTMITSKIYFDYNFILFHNFFLFFASLYIYKNCYHFTTAFLPSLSLVLTDFIYAIFIHVKQNRMEMTLGVEQETGAIGERFSSDFSVFYLSGIIE